MQTKYSTKDIERFWGKVDKEKSNTFYNGSRCWEWTGAHFDDGYGGIKIFRKMYKTHRLSYSLAYGEILSGLQVLHHCDNRNCCNPLHLFIGTNKDNQNDKVQKHRQAKGETIGKSKLLNFQVAEIRRRYAWFGIGGDSAITPAKEFGVSPQTIIYIVKNKTWR
jgi:hypothetical protein